MEREQEIEDHDYRQAGGSPGARQRRRRLWLRIIITAARHHAGVDPRCHCGSRQHHSGCYCSSRCHSGRHDSAHRRQN
jgi:hypothetical protein